MTNEDKKIWGNENPFSVPDGYFESFNNQLQNKINPSGNSGGKLPKRISLFAPWIGLAAAFLIIALAYRQLPERVFPNKFKNTQVDTEMIYELSPWYLPGDFELMEYISNKDGFNPDIYPDSIMFEGLNEEDLIMLTLFQ